MTSKPSRLKRVLRLFAVTAAGFYAAWCGLLHFKQSDMIFPRQFTNPRPNAAPPAGTESIFITLADGARVEGWFTPAKGEAAPAVLYCHGNAELIDDNLGVIREYTKRGVSVLLIEYPGYGRSTGEPSQASTTEAGTKFFDLLAARPEVDPSKIILHGKSLGGGVAAQIAAKKPAAAIILESTFTSVASFAAGYGVPAFLLSHPFRTNDVLKADTRPLLIFHGAQDEIIPVAHGRNLAALRPDAAYIETPGHHNDYPTDPAAYWREIDAFLAKHKLTP